MTCCTLRSSGMLVIVRLQRFVGRFGDDVVVYDSITTILLSSRLDGSSTRVRQFHSKILSLFERRHVIDGQGRMTAVRVPLTVAVMVWMAAAAVIATIVTTGTTTANLATDICSRRCRCGRWTGAPCGGVIRRRCCRCWSCRGRRIVHHVFPTILGNTVQTRGVGIIKTILLVAVVECRRGRMLVMMMMRVTLVMMIILVRIRFGIVQWRQGRFEEYLNRIVVVVIIIIVAMIFVVVVVWNGRYVRRSVSTSLIIIVSQSLPNHILHHMVVVGCHVVVMGLLLEASWWWIRTR